MIYEADSQLSLALKQARDVIETEDRSLHDHQSRTWNSCTGFSVKP